MAYNAHATILKPMFKYYAQYVTIDSTNNQLTIREASGVDIVATVTPGTYTYGELAYQAKKALRSVAAAGYTIRYSYRTGYFTLTSDLTNGATIFEIRSGGLATVMGFTAHQTSASTYTSTTRVPSLTTVTFTRNLRAPRAARSVDREDLILGNGRAESISFGTVKRYSFQVEYEPPSVIQALYDMLEGIGERGGVVQFYPDSTNSTDYMDVTFSEKDFDLPEQTDQGFYRHYAFSFALREAVPNTGTLTLRSLLDRRPNT